MQALRCKVLGNASQAAARAIRAPAPVSVRRVNNVSARALPVEALQAIPESQLIFGGAAIGT